MHMLPHCPPLIWREGASNHLGNKSTFFSSVLPPNPYVLEDLGTVEKEKVAWFLNSSCLDEIMSAICLRALSTSESTIRKPSSSPISCEGTIRDYTELHISGVTITLPLLYVKKASEWTNTLVVFIHTCLWLQSPFLTSAHNTASAFNHFPPKRNKEM